MLEGLFRWWIIPTKNLYIASLEQCVSSDLMPGGFDYKLKDLGCVALVRIIEKDYKKYYQDIFTKTLYAYDPPYLVVENIYIGSIIPVVLTKPYITYKEALLAYNTLNNISQDSVKSLQKRKKH